MLGDVVPTIACVHASIVIHKYILSNILKSPLAFFEITPVGRVLARFSKDVDVVDNQLPRQIIVFLGCLFKVRSNVTIWCIVNIFNLRSVINDMTKETKNS